MKRSRIEPPNRSGGFPAAESGRLENRPSGLIRVLVVDDSALVRRMITDALRCASGIEVVGTASDPYEARDKILSLNPDVLTLDIEMPRMDGVSFLKLLAQHHPLPVIVISSLTQRGSHMALEALEAGAVDVLAKPASIYDVTDLASQLRIRIKAAATSRHAPLREAVAARPVVSPRCESAVQFHPQQLILLGASTGGTQALKQVLAKLPEDLPGICIVQHMPRQFSRTFAESLDRACGLRVREAAHDDIVRPGEVLVAPGDFHMTVNWRGDAHYIALNQRPPVHYCRPAVDVLFQSAAKSSGPHTVAALLTGMGSDGAIGMKRLQECGAHTIAQDEETSVVYGMPRAALELGGVNEVRPLHDIAAAICSAGSLRAAVAHDSC